MFLWYLTIIKEQVQQNEQYRFINCIAVFFRNLFKYISGIALLNCWMSAFSKESVSLNSLFFSLKSSRRLIASYWEGLSAKFGSLGIVCLTYGVFIATNVYSTLVSMRPKCLFSPPPRSGSIPAVFVLSSFLLFWGFDNSMLFVPWWELETQI